MKNLQQIIIENQSLDQTPEQALAEYDARDLEALRKSRKINVRNIRGMRKYGTQKQVIHYLNIGAKIDRQIRRLESKPIHLYLAAG